MGNGASATQPVPNAKDGKLSSSSKQQQQPQIAFKEETMPPPGVAMRAPWGSCVLSLHVASLFSKLDFDVSTSVNLGCLHSIAVRFAPEQESDASLGVSESAFAAAERELGLLPRDLLKDQQVLFKDAAEKLEDFHEFAQTHGRIFCNDHIRSTFQRKKSHFQSTGTAVSTVPWLHSVVHAGVLFMMINCKLLQFDVNPNLAQSVFQVSRPQETSAVVHEVKWEEDVTQTKNWGQKPKDPKQASTIKSDLMRADAPDFEWAQPWEQLWSNQTIPSLTSAHHLIERTHKLWESEMTLLSIAVSDDNIQASLRPLWFGARTGICPPLSCVIEEHGFFIKVIALCPSSSSGPINIFSNVNLQLAQLRAECNRLPLLKHYGHFIEGRQYYLMAPLFTTPVISAPAAAAFISSKHGFQYSIGQRRHSFSITQDSAVLSVLQPDDAVEFHLLRRSLVHRVQPSLLSAAGQMFNVTDGEQRRKMPVNHVPGVLNIASDEELPFMPVSQRLVLLQVAMFDLLPELIELLDNAFQPPASASAREHNHTLIIEDHMRLLRKHFKTSGLGLMWLGVVRTHCSSPSAQAVALNEMAARVIKLDVRRRMRATKVQHHKDSDGTDVAQTPKEDCILVHDTLNEILQEWRSFSRNSLFLLMAAKYPGCLLENELEHPELMFSSINPMLCIERVARLLRISLDMTAFNNFARDFPTGDTIFPSDTHQAPSLAHSVVDALKSAAAPFVSISLNVDQQLAALTDDIIVSTSSIIKSHCPVDACQAVAVLLEMRMLMISAAGLMSQTSTDSSVLDMNPVLHDFQKRSICEDAFLCAYQPEHTSAGELQQNIKLSPVMRIVSQMNHVTHAHAVLQFKKMSNALQSIHLELLHTSSSCVHIMIECLLALSDVANGSSKSFFLRSALEWTDSLWKAQEVTSIRAIRALRSRANMQMSILKKLQLAGSGPSKVDFETMPDARLPRVKVVTPDLDDESSAPVETPKKYVNNAKASAMELAQEKERIEQAIKHHDRDLRRIQDKLYHASVFVFYLCSCTPTAIVSKLKSQWRSLIAGFDLAYRKFISDVPRGVFSAIEVKRVLWHTIMLLRPLANEFKVLQSCRNPSASLLLEVVAIFAKFSVALDELASSHFDRDFSSNYTSIFETKMRHVIYFLSSSLQQHLLFPNCPSVVEATSLLMQGSYYQIIHGEMQAIAQEMKDTVEKLEGTSVRQALSLFARGKPSDPQQRRDEEAMRDVVSQLALYCVSDDFLSVEPVDMEKGGGNPVAALISCMVAHGAIQLQGITLIPDSSSKSMGEEKGSRCMDLNNATITHDVLHCVSILLEGRGISSVNCSRATLCGSIPASFAQLLRNVTHLNLQGFKVKDVEDDCILRKLLTCAVSATHVNLNYTRSITDEELCDLANASGSHLVSLQICQNLDITDFGLCYLATRCSSLQHLHLPGCDNVAGQFVDFIAAYCPHLASLDMNFAGLKQASVSLLPQLTDNQSLRLNMRDIDLITKLGAAPSYGDVTQYLKNLLSANAPQFKNLHDSKWGLIKSRSRLNSVLAHVKFAGAAPSIEPVHVQTEGSASKSTNRDKSVDPDAAIRVSVAEANRVFGEYERVNQKALACIEQWITLLYGPSESNRAWLQRGDFASDMMIKYDAATDDYLVINEEDPEFEVQFNDMLPSFTVRGIDSDQCAREVKAVLLKRRIEQKENVMAERRLVAEMERDRRTHSTKSEYEEIYYMSGRAAQDADAVRRIEVEVEIATRRQMHLDRFRSLKGPTNIEFTPQTFMRTDSLLKNSADRVAVHPVLHVYVHCVLYENENSLGSSKISSFINVTYDRHWRTTHPLEHSNFVEVTEGYTFDLRYGLSDMVVIEMREASASAFENASQANTRMIGIVFAPLPEFVNGKPEKLWYRFKGVPPKVRESAGKLVPTLGGQVLLSTMITTSEVRKRLDHALDSLNKVEVQDVEESLIDRIRHSVGSKLNSMFSRKPLKQQMEEERLAKKAREEQLRAAVVLKNKKQMEMLKQIIATKVLPTMMRPLVHLDLSSSCVHDGAVVPIILQATNLTVLRLSHCSNLTPELFASIISDNVALRDAAGSPLHKLCTLSMRNTPACNDAAVIRICAASTSLHSLDIGESQRRVTNASVSVLAEVHGSKLKRLMIDNCPAVTEDFQNMLFAAVGASCSTLDASFQSISPFAMSFITSKHLLELKLNGISSVSSADVRRVCRSSRMLRVLLIEHCHNIDDGAFICDRALNLQEVSVSYCVALTDIGILRLICCSPRLQTLSIASLPLISNASLLCVPARCPCLTFLNLAFCSKVSSITIQALPVMLPNAKFVGIESLSFGNSEMSHVQVKRLPDVEPHTSARERRAHDQAALPESQGNTSNALSAARRVFNAVRLSGKVSLEAQQRVSAQAAGSAQQQKPE